MKKLVFPIDRFMIADTQKENYFILIVNGVDYSVMLV